MPDREWPVHRARAWLLRKAADLIDAGNDGAGVSVRYLAAIAIDANDDRYRTENGFRYLLTQALGADFDGPTANRAVVEVYGDLVATSADPVDSILAKLSAEAQRVPLGAAFRGGPLDDAPIYDVYRWAEKTIRRISGRKT